MTSKIEEVEPEGVLTAHGEDVAADLARVQSICSEEGVQVLIRLSTLDEYELFRFYESGGVHTYCDVLLGGKTEDADDVDAKLMFMITAQVLLAVGQVRSLMVLRGVVVPLSEMACNLLRMTGIEGGTEKDLAMLRIEAAGCLNILPLPLEKWCDNDIPALCMGMLADRSFLEEGGTSDVATGGGSSVVDAGLMVVGNFMGSEEFFEVVLDMGLVEEVVRLGEVLTEEVYMNELYQFTMIRYLTLFLSIVSIPAAKAKLDFIDAGLEEASSPIRHLLPTLATHPHLTIRSLAHQALADYTSVTTPTHEWVTTIPPITTINQSSPAFNKKRPCSNPICSMYESVALEFAWCAKCKVTAYCSPACQKAHWQHHKKICKSLII